MDTLRIYMYCFCVSLLVFGFAIQVDTSTVVERMEKRCKQYAESVYEIIPDPILLPGAQPKRRDTCRISTQTTIVGGERAGPQEFPHMALIGYGNKPILWRCGGSLISEQWVLSAAHCVETPDTNELARYARLGDLDIISTGDDASPSVYRIARRIRHRNYRPPQAYNDIALFKLDAVVKFNRFIRPICLHGLLSPSNNTVLASGWGATFYEGTQSSHLLKVGLNVIGNDQCNKQWRENVAEVDVWKFRKVLAKGVKEAIQVCAWAENKDSCQGDSGGPIQQVLSDPYCMYNIIGVISIGNKCQGKIPSIYTRVSHYLPWIESHVWPQS